MGKYDELSETERGSRGMEAQAKYKHDGVTEEDTKQQLANALNKAIQLIIDMSMRKVAVPWDTIIRWHNLIKYAEKED